MKLHNKKQWETEALDVIPWASVVNYHHEREKRTMETNRLLVA